MIKSIVKPNKNKRKRLWHSLDVSVTTITILKCGYSKTTCLNKCVVDFFSGNKPKRFVFGVLTNVTLPKVFVKFSIRSWNLVRWPTALLSSFGAEKTKSRKTTATLIKITFIIATAIDVTAREPGFNVTRAAPCK